MMASRKITDADMNLDVDEEEKKEFQLVLFDLFIFLISKNCRGHLF